MTEPGRGRMEMDADLRSGMEAERAALPPKTDADLTRFGDWLAGKMTPYREAVKRITRNYWDAQVARVWKRTEEKERKGKE